MMAMLLLMMVEVGLVVGVMEPITPYGAYSVTIMPPSPVTTCGLEVFGARSPGRDQQVLLHLVLGSAETGFGMCHVGQAFPFAQHGGPHRLDDRSAGFQAHLAVGTERVREPPLTAASMWDGIPSPSRASARAEIFGARGVLCPHRPGPFGRATRPRTLSMIDWISSSFST